MENTAGPSRSKQDRNVYLPQDFDLNTEARCSICDGLVNVHKWVDHKKDCFVTKNFKCEHCCSEYNHEVNLVIHSLLKHSSSGCMDCTVCKKKFKREAAFRGHVNTHFIADKLVCVECREEFLTPAELSRHRRLSHSENPSMTEALICCYCGEIFSPQDLDSHKRKHIYERVLMKKSESTKKKPSKKSDKPVVRSHICLVCEKAFRRPKELERHEAVHSESRKYKCSYCPSEFRHENVWLAHEKLHKKTKKAFKCRICDHNFNSKYNLHRHLQVTHMRKENEGTRKRRVVDEVEQIEHLDDEVLPIEHQIEDYPDHELMHYVDDVENEDGRIMENGEEWEELQGNEEMRDDDGEGNWDLDEVTGGDLAEQLFENREYPKERIVVVPENSLRCPACAHSIDNVEQLMTHFQTLAPKDPAHRHATFHCLFCPEAVPGMGVFTHLFSHGITPQSNRPIPVNIIARPHACLSCEKTFTKKIDLTRHIRTHTGEKPFACPICGERFRVENTLKRHERTHEEIDASHECTLCFKAFFSRNALRTHMINHTTPCSFCPQTFRSNAERDEHTMREHRNGEIGSGIGSRVGGMMIPSIPGGMNTLTQICRPSVSKKLERREESAFQALPSNWNEEEETNQRMVNISADPTANDGVLINLSRKPQLRPSGRPCGGESSVSFSVPHELLSSLKDERGLLTTQLNRGRVVSMHPSETLSAIESTNRMDIHPTQSQTVQPYEDTQSLRSSSFVPVHLNSDDYFIDHCNVCEVSLSTKEDSDSHMRSEDHETATLLAPHSSMESSTSQMVCKLCGNRFVSMALLVSHISVVHERDLPKSLAPLNLHTSSILSSKRP